jgi:hypothetical protein
LRNSSVDTIDERRNFGSEFTVDVAIGVVFASQVIGVRVSQFGHTSIVDPSATNLDGSIPNDLSKVTSVETEDRIVVVVVADFVVPKVDLVRWIGVSTVCQVLTVVQRVRVSR